MFTCSHSKMWRVSDAYLPHPEHKKFGDLLGKLQVVEDVFVVDFVTE